jgi:glycosyltransferase involved in cell wall biosynthesis
MDQAFHCDLIDVHWTYPDIVAAHRLAIRMNRKFVVTVRGHEALYLEENTIRRWLVARYLRKADCVVALSGELRDKVIGLGVDAVKVHVVLNGVDQSRFAPADRTACRARLGLPAHKRILLSIGRFTEGKGHQDVIEALPRLAAAADVELYIIGGVNPEGDFKAKLEALVAERGLHNVHLIDKVEHSALRDWYCAADVFCLATKREGCPNVVLEALACGTPVVVSDVGAVSEVVTSDENGYLVTQARPMAEALGAALARTWDAAQIAASMNRWSWARCAQQLRAIYGAMLPPEIR